MLKALSLSKGTSPGGSLVSSFLTSPRAPISRNTTPLHTIPPPEYPTIRPPLASPLLIPIFMNFPILKQTPPPSSRRIHYPAPVGSLSRILFVAFFVFAVSLTGAFASNPWDSSSLGWSSTGWGSWDASASSWFPHRVSESSPSLAPAPKAVINADIDPVMVKAGNIAEGRALSHSSLFCWRYVKEALVKAGGVASYPQTAYAKDAGRDLVENHGFVKLAVRSAAQAPVGSVLVYGGYGAGHVELRTTHGFVSDYHSSRPSSLPFIGAFTRIEKHSKSIRTAQADHIADTRS
jgi:hypothetical protein